MAFLSAAITLFLVLDPIGNVPAWLAVLRSVSPERRTRVVLRENLIALAGLLVFLFGGPWLLAILGVAGPALPVAGGVVIFLIALRMIFPQPGGIFGDEAVSGEPLVVPLAIPLLAGPSALATITLLATTREMDFASLTLAVLLAWAVSAAILLAGPRVAAVLGDRGMIAAERLMGMLLTIIAVHMIMVGVHGYLFEPTVE